jgi:hypothetical protein
LDVLGRPVHLIEGAQAKPRRLTTLHGANSGLLLREGSVATIERSIEFVEPIWY